MDSSVSRTGEIELDVRLACEADIVALAENFHAEGWTRSPEQLQRYLLEQEGGIRLFFVASLGPRVVGYLTLTWDADYPSFRRDGIPELQDLSVLPSMRRLGIATRLLDEAEARAAERVDAVGLSVGLYAGYGGAQRLYSLRGYHPDGQGATSRHRRLFGAERVEVDDSLSLHLIKLLRPSR